MQTILRHIAIALLCGALCIPSVDARGRKDADDRPRHENKAHGPSQRAGQRDTRVHRNNAAAARKEHNAIRHDGNRRPQGNHGNHNGYRPGGHRPGHTPPHRPAASHRPQRHPGYHHGHHHVNFGRPHRPHMPPPRPYFRPVPPPRHWHPHVWRPFHTILGVTLGSAINISINALLNSGYNVCGYDNDIVYLSDVPMLNYSWPAANLYYGDGGLYGSEFVYSTPGYNMRRYNDVYSSLISVYGAPYQVQTLSGGGRRATWWGNNGQYITLSFGGNYSTGGGLRYYTTLSFGR